MNGISHPQIHEPGIFMNMPEREYHQALALSASGIKWLRASPLDWWVRSPLNPEYVEEETEAKNIGKAFHCRIVEGKAAFNDRYAPALDAAAYPDALRTNEQLLDAIKVRGYSLPKATRKADLISYLGRMEDCPPIWEQLVEAHRQRTAGRVLLEPSLIQRIETAAAMIERHPELGRAFTGGYAEVAVFWIDEETGIPCKARLDYLKPRVIVDLKTASNPFGMPFDRAAMRAIANYRYHLQAAWYLDAMRHHEPDVERTWLWVFQQQGPAPIARGYVLGPGTLLDIARQEIAEAKATWKRCWDAYGTDPWVDVTSIREVDPMEVPAYVAE